MEAALREKVRRVEVDTSGRGGMVVRDEQVGSVADCATMTGESVRRADITAAVSFKPGRTIGGRIGTGDEKGTFKVERFLNNYRVVGEAGI